MLQLYRKKQVAYVYGEAGPMTSKKSGNNPRKERAKTMYDTNNIFAKIIRGDIPSKKVYEDDTVLAFHDITPAAPVHVLVVPKGEYVSILDFTQKAGAEEVGRFFARVNKIADKLGVAQTGYRLLTNHGADASQSVPHFHVHILGGRALGGLLPGDKNTR
jgi:diadenosine tetraphosphate (Ap4A) HIT family hydrolase